MTMTSYTLFYNQSSESHSWAAEEGRVFSGYLFGCTHYLPLAPIQLGSALALGWLHILIVMPDNLYHQKLCFKIGIFLRMRM